MSNFKLQSRKKTFRLLKSIRCTRNLSPPCEHHVEALANGRRTKYRLILFCAYLIVTLLLSFLYKVLGCDADWTNTTNGKQEDITSSILSCQVTVCFWIGIIVVSSAAWNEHILQKLFISGNHETEIFKQCCQRCCFPDLPWLAAMQ